MKTYIKKDHNGYYVQFTEEIDAEYWNGMIGTTYKDFDDNKWVLLSDEQVAFHETHPNASIKEVFEMSIKENTSPNRNLESAKFEKLGLIQEYDLTKNVFRVISGNNTVTTWLTPEERSNYKSSIDAAELMGINILSLYIDNVEISLPLNTAKRILAQIQLYADSCFLVTKQHETAIESLTSVEDVDSYDITLGYPEVLTFDLAII